MVLLAYHITDRAAAPVIVAAATRKQAHIIIMISANCGDGSVTVSVDMLHIVSITPNCCSRPCHRKMLKILHVWSCGLLWNWKWMVINYNDDHHGERFCATGYLTVWASLRRVGLKRKALQNYYRLWRILHVDLESHSSWWNKIIYRQQRKRIALNQKKKKKKGNSSDAKSIKV